MHLATHYKSAKNAVEETSYQLVPVHVVGDWLDLLDSDSIDTIGSRWRAGDSKQVRSKRAEK